MNTLSYGVIGNCTSAALVSATGSIDWCCLPEFDSSAVFCRLLDAEKGGEFAFEVDSTFTISQQYIENTNILSTLFTNGIDVFEVIDFMPRYPDESGLIHCPPDIVRYIRHHSGKPVIRIRYNPRLNFAEHPTQHSINHEYIKSTTSGGSYESIYLHSNVSYQDILDGRNVSFDCDLFFLLSYNQKLVPIDVRRIRLLFERTRVCWLNWVNRTYQLSMHPEIALRSALLLKLLSFERTGALLAAVTTSVPESPGESRTWDYRYCWIRDASMIITTLVNIGHYNSAKRFLKFVLNVLPFKGQRIQIMYGIRGERDIPERTLEWLDGYEGVKPVRVGNQAYVQLQNDVFGILLDVLHKNFTLFKGSIGDSENLWTIVRSMARYAMNHWTEPDHGIWEFRNRKEHFTFSKMLCWVAMDRAAKIAEFLQVPSYAVEWRAMADKIKADIFEKGWNPRMEAFTQYYGSDCLDASNLLMAFYDFLPPTDPYYVKTVQATKKALLKDGLMYRYTNEDDFGKPNSSFTVCTFWLIRSLHLIGEKEEAHALLDQVLEYANHLGLYSEDIEFKSKRLTGNFPQGYSHLALIDALITMSDNKTDPVSEMSKRLGFSIE